MREEHVDKIEHCNMTGNMGNSETPWLSYEWNNGRVLHRTALTSAVGDCCAGLGWMVLSSQPGLRRVRLSGSTR